MKKDKDYDKVVKLLENRACAWRSVYLSNEYSDLINDVIKATKKIVIKESKQLKEIKILKKRFTQYILNKDGLNYNLNKRRIKNSKL